MKDHAGVPHNAKTMPETENPEDPVCLSWKFPGTRFNESLGSCQEIARHSDAKWPLRLDILGCQRSDRHDPTSLSPLWWDFAWRDSLSCNLHDGTLVTIIAIITIIENARARPPAPEMGCHADGLAQRVSSEFMLDFWQSPPACF